MARQIQAKRMKRRSSVKARSKTSVRRGTSSRAITVSNTNVSYNNPTRVITFPGYGFPDRLRIRIAYSDVQTYTLTSIGLFSSNTYRMNSLFDPDQTGVGAQPYWRDQLATIYNKYRVLGCKMTSTFTRASESAAGHGPYVCGIQTGNSTSTTSFSSAGLMTTANTTYEILNQDNGPVKVVATYAPNQAFGPKLLADNLSASMGANPTTPWYGITFVAHEGTATPTIVKVFTTLEFFVEVSEQIQNVGS